MRTGKCWFRDCIIRYYRREQLSRDRDRRRESPLIPPFPFRSQGKKKRVSSRISQSQTEKFLLSKAAKRKEKKNVEKRRDEENKTVCMFPWFLSHVSDKWIQPMLTRQRQGSSICGTSMPCDLLFPTVNKPSIMKCGIRLWSAIKLLLYRGILTQSLRARPNFLGKKKSIG